MKPRFALLMLALSALAVPAVSNAEPISDHSVAVASPAVVVQAQLTVPTIQTAQAVLAQAADPAVTQADDLATLANQVVEAITHGNWALVAALVIVIITLALRRWGGQYLPWLNSKWAGVLIPLLGSIAGAVATALMGGLPLTAGLLLKAVIVGVIAIGGFSAAKNAGQAAGLVPVKPVASLADAAGVLDRTARGPQP